MGRLASGESVQTNYQPEAMDEMPSLTIPNADAGHLRR